MIHAGILPIVTAEDDATALKAREPELAGEDFARFVSLVERMVRLSLGAPEPRDLVWRLLASVPPGDAKVELAIVVQRHVDAAIAVLVLREEVRFIRGMLYPER